MNPKSKSLASSYTSGQQSIAARPKRYVSTFRLADPVSTHSDFSRKFCSRAVVGPDMTRKIGHFGF